MKNVGDAGFSRKRGGNAGSGPPNPDPDIRCCRCKNFSLKQASGLKGGDPYPSDTLPGSATAYSWWAFFITLCLMHNLAPILLTSTGCNKTPRFLANKSFGMRIYPSNRLSSPPMEYYKRKQAANLLNFICWAKGFLKN